MTMMPPTSRPPGDTSVRLSICIATFNRARFLPETLASLLPQLTDDVEVLIVDGASTDHTPEVARQWAERDQRIRYVRLPVKGGVDRDYCHAVELARGEYCWLFTDDDLLRPGAIARVLAELARGFELVVVNGEVRGPALDQVLQANMVGVSGDREYGADELDRLFQDVVRYISFIGAVVIRRALWLSREKERYFGLEFVHVAVVFQEPLPGRALLVTEPLIVIRHGNASWAPRSFTVWMFQWPGLVHSLDAVPAPTRRRVVPPEPWRRLGALCIERTKGSYTLGMYQRWLRGASASLPWRGAALGIALAPRRLVKWITRAWFADGRLGPIHGYDLAVACTDRDRA